MSPSHIRTPPDDTPIWRYMDLLKFFDLIQTGELFFTRLDRFKDMREGTLPEAVFAADAVMRDNANTIAAAVRETACASCWFKGDDEESEMWEEFAARGTGVAIKSTVGRLKTAFRNTEGEQFIGEVEYVDFAGRVCARNGRDLTAALCLKDGSFKHENEVRALVFTDDDGTPGVRVQVVLEALIEAVVVGPSAVKDLTQKVVQRALTSAAVGAAVHHSRIHTGRKHPSPNFRTGYHAEYGYMDLYTLSECNECWHVCVFDSKRNVKIWPDERFKSEPEARLHAVHSALDYLTERARDPAPHNVDGISWDPTV